MGLETAIEFMEKSYVVASATGSMQKSKSSSSVHHAKSKLTKKSIFGSRSKSQTRSSVAASNWTPQGSCIWNSIGGKQVALGESSLLHLTQVERKVLQKVALAKLQALNLGVTVTLPADNVTPVVTKPKRKTYLLKRKALTTGIFDTNRKDIDKEKETSGTGGLVFGIPLGQCVENDKLSRIASGACTFRSRDELSSFDEPTMGRHGSRASFSSLIDAERAEEKSCDNLLGRDGIVGSVPGLLNTISSSSTADIVAAQAEEEPAVPNILSTCIKYLETQGLHTLGLFRVSTSKKRIRQLREDFDCGKEAPLEDNQCPHDVATLIKEYLRELPDPLLCRDLYHAFVQTQRIRHRRLQLEALQYLIQLLPSANRDTLFALLKFLANVAKYSNDYRNALGEEVLGNKMDANNLATVFAPNILHCIKPGSKDASVDRPEDRTDVINVIRTLIEHYRELFNVSSELLDEVYMHMMDLHPETLDQLLSKKEESIAAEESLDDLDSESLSAPWSPSQNSEQDYGRNHRIMHDLDGHEVSNERRKTYSREEFLHESAATGGPDLAMKIRYKDRYRDRASRKKREETDLRRKRDGDICVMTRSASIEASSHQDTVQPNDRRKSSPYLLDSHGVITASLTIPVQTGNQAQPLNIDDGIPYIEDGIYGYSTDGRHQMNIDVLRSSPAAPPRRRQRSVSGSDSSVASNVHAITGSISLGQQGYDSAMGSSATFSTPPHNTTPSSISSSIADPGALSSPPSWASTPPTSPDSHNTSVNYIPDDISGKIVRTIPIQIQSTVTKDSPILQKITFTSTSELQQLQKAKQIDVKQQQRDSLQKSPSSPAFTLEKQQEQREYTKFSPSITSIGNAVLRSKTADFERISKTDVKPLDTVATQKTSTISEKKKYTKRRYTDSRHQTRHIPDSETLEASQSNLPVTKADKNVNQSGPVYKRREIISSVPSQSHTKY